MTCLDEFVSNYMISFLNVCLNGYLSKTFDYEAVTI